MDYLIHTLLKPSEAKLFRQRLLQEECSWQDGKRTAGHQAAKVKNNSQLDKDSPIAIEKSTEIVNEIKTNQLLKSYCLPKSIHGVMFTRSNDGQGYGMHVDNVYMRSGRSDLSFTLFLSAPNDYEGGELCIQTMQDNKEIKLKEGQIIIYPNTYLHAVKTVTRGERLACIGWIQSYIRNNEDRNILFSLHAGAQGLLALHDNSPELDLIFQSYNNLLRRLGD